VRVLEALLAYALFRIFNFLFFFILLRFLRFYFTFRRLFDVTVRDFLPFVFGWFDSGAFAFECLWG
jgi:hypothetical protein